VGSASSRINSPVDLGQRRQDLAEHGVDLYVTGYQHCTPSLTRIFHLKTDNPRDMSGTGSGCAHSRPPCPAFPPCAPCPLHAHLLVLPVSLHATRTIPSMSSRTHALRLLRKLCRCAQVVFAHFGWALCARRICSDTSSAVSRGSVVRWNWRGSARRRLCAHRGTAWRAGVYHDVHGGQV
jgi:hypothetical protein